MGDRFLPHELGMGGWFGDNASALHLMCTLSLLLLHQLHLRSSGIESQRLGTLELVLTIISLDALWGVF